MPNAKNEKQRERLGPQFPFEAASSIPEKISMSHTIQVTTFLPGDNAHGESGPAYEGNLRKGELRGIIHINKDKCVGCDTAASSARPTH